MTWLLTALKTRLGQAVALALAVLGVLGLAYRKGGSEALKTRDQEDMQNAYDREKTRAEIERNSDSSDARDRLRKDWRRD
jgi:hypothetical protein